MTFLQFLVIFRPQLLVLCKLTPELDPKYRRVISLASQLKAGQYKSGSAGVIVICAFCSRSGRFFNDFIENMHSIIQEFPANLHTRKGI